MEELTLVPMTRELCHRFFRGFTNDGALFPGGECGEYVYDREKADQYFLRQQRPDRIDLALCLAGEPIGEVKLKDIDPEAGECSLGIHLQNDAVKGRGYGRRGEIMAVEYAFQILGLRAVNADVLTTNHRSRHVLERAGFAFLRQEGDFCYYRRERRKTDGDLE